MDKTLYYLSKCLRNGKYWVLIFLILLISSSSKNDSREIRLLFVGDILLSRNVKEEIKTRETFPLESLKTLFHSADLTVGNLEGAVGNIQDKYESPVESPVFAIDSTDIAMLRDAGFKTITVENNHSFDLGFSGKVKTIETLRTNLISPVDFDNSPQFFTINDMVISILALNLVIGRDSLKNVITSVEIKQKLRLAGNLSNIVIVSIHWGSELLDWPSREQRDVAGWLIKNGADIIIGSHPHVVQKPELIEGRPVFFSLGNHLFDQKYKGTKEGLIADIRIQDGKIICNGLVTHTRTNSFYPEISDTINYNFAPIPYRSTTLTINDYMLKPISVNTEFGNRIILQAIKDDKVNWKTQPMSIVSISSCKLDGKNENLFALEKHYSSLDKEITVRPYVYSLDNEGLIARWRGSALAWPLIDAIVSPVDDKILCALHRGDSFINPDKSDTNRRIAAYNWNGFGFKGISDSIACEICDEYFKEK